MSENNELDLTLQQTYHNINIDIYVIIIWYIDTEPLLTVTAGFLILDLNLRYNAVF